MRRRRRELHLRVAEAAEALYGASDETIDLLARHLYLGGAGPKAVDYLVRAGRRAKLLYANEEAILDFERAAELAPEDPEILIELADLRELIGDYEQALALYTKVRDATADIDPWRGLAATLRKQGRYDDALGVIEQAFKTDALQGADLRPLWLERAWTLTVAGRADAAADAAHVGLESSRAQDAMRGHLLLRLATAEIVAGRFESAIRHGLEAKALFETGGSELRGLATTLRVVGDAHRELGRLDEAAATLREGLAVAERIGNVEDIGGCLINLAIVERWRGAYDDAAMIALRAIDEFERIGHASGRVTIYVNMAEIQMMREDYEEARRFAAKALDLAREIGHSLAIAATLETMTEIDLRTGDFAAAAARAEEAAAKSLEIGAVARAAHCMELAAEAWSKLGDEERAEASAARARSLA